jgi:superkiller protein 3
MKSRPFLLLSLSVTVGIISNVSARSETPSAKVGMINPIAIRPGSTLKGRVDRDVAMGDELMLKGKYADAADFYRQAINRNSKDVAAIVGLGMALGKQFKLDGAQEQFDKALELDSNNPMAHAGMGMVLLNRLQSSSMTYARNRDSMLKQAETECRTALNSDPSMPEAHYTLGQVYKEEGNLGAAVSEYQAATQSDPNYSEAYSGLGMAKLMQGSLAEASSAFHRAIQLNSGNSTAHYGMGRVLLAQGRIDEALKELNTSAYQFPNSAPLHLALGQAYSTQGNNNAALKEYRQSIAIKPENPDAYLGIADIRESRGDLELSISELRSGIEMMPNNTDLHMRVANEDLQLEKLDDAIKEYVTVLNSNPGSADAAKGLTRAYYLKAQKEATGALILSNEYEDAQHYIDQAVQMNPNDMELRLAQMKLRAMSGMPVDLSSVGPPHNDGERVAYAEALLAQNKFQESRDQMNQVIASASNPRELFAVGDLALLIHDLDSAESAYRKAQGVAGGQDRAKRGLTLTAKAREEARQDLTLAQDLARKRQLASAVDKYHAAIFENPRVPDSRIGLAQTLERLSRKSAADLREAAIQWRAYVALEPDMPDRDKKKYEARAKSDDDRAFRMENKGKPKPARPTQAPKPAGSSSSHPLLRRLGG